MLSAGIVAIGVLEGALVVLSQIALWQRKEYRIDRMASYINSPEGSLARQGTALVSAALLVAAWVLFYMQMGAVAEYIAMGSMVAVLIGHGMRIVKKGVIRPDWTYRAFGVLLATGASSLAVLSLVSLLEQFIALEIATILFLLPGIVFVCVMALGIPVQLQKRVVITRARKKREQLQNMTVVGITGSVGKTSTKTYLLHLLGGQSNEIIATGEHRNSPYVVAKDMLEKLSEKTKIYIAEMGAYRKGEIAELVQLTHANIGIVTAITNQHVALFGSLAALANTKWELIDFLPEDGTAILHAGDATIVKQAKGLKKKAVWFSADEHAAADIQVSGLELHSDHTSCTLIIAGNKYAITLPIISRGQIIPYLAAVSAAHVLGVSDEDIVKQSKTLPVLPRTMEIRHGKQGATIIDDSYSASEASVVNAIEYAASLSDPSVRIVLVPIIELGSEGHRVHERIGKLLSGTKLSVYVYGDAYKEDILRGLGENPAATVTWHTDAKQLVSAVTENISKTSIIVLEGRVPALLREQLL